MLNYFSCYLTQGQKRLSFFATTVFPQNNSVIILNGAWCLLVLRLFLGRITEVLTPISTSPHSLFICLISFEECAARGGTEERGCRGRTPAFPLPQIKTDHHYHKKTDKALSLPNAYVVVRQRQRLTLWFGKQFPNVVKKAVRAKDAGNAMR